MSKILKLMDVKTLVAGVTPVIIGSLYAFYRYDSLNILDLILLLIGIILLQSCANMVNDYYDYKRGADDETKAHEKALASGEVSPKEVKRIIYGFLLVDIVIALYFSIRYHPLIFLVGIVGTLIMISYSAGKRPISHTPFGEVTAGTTMGFGIMTTTIYIQAGLIGLDTFLVALPTAIYIGTILLTNNISDHREDALAGRKTLPLIMGIDRAQWLWVIACNSLIALGAAFVMFGYWPMFSLFFILLLFPYREVVGFRDIDKTLANKGRMMGLIGRVGIRYHLALAIGFLAGKLLEMFT